MFWLVNFVMICGIAIDATNGYRVKAMLQSTADAAALAASMSLPNIAAAKAAGASYGADNLPFADHGVAVTEDQIVPCWFDPDATPKCDPAGKIFDGELAFNAVQATASRTDTAGNALRTLVTRIVGITYFEVNATATALAFVDRCLEDGIVAEDRVSITSNNALVNSICFHGEGANDPQGIAVDLQNNNTFACGVRVSMPSIDDLLSVPSDPFAGSDAADVHCAPVEQADGSYQTPAGFPDTTYDSGNPGLYEALTEDHLGDDIQREIQHQIEVVLGFAGLSTVRDGNGDVIDVIDNGTPTLDIEAPFYRVRPYWMTAGTLVTDLTRTEFEDGIAAGTLNISDNPTPQILYVTCSGGGNNTLKLSGLITNVAIITDCEIDGGSATIETPLTLEEAQALVDEAQAEVDRICRSPTDSRNPCLRAREDLVAAQQVLAEIMAAIEDAGEGEPVTGGAGTCAQTGTGIVGTPSLVMCDVILMSTAVGSGAKPRDKAVVKFPAASQLGTANCDTREGSVWIGSLATIQFPAQGNFNGAQFITEGSVQMAAQQDGYNGINVLAGDDVSFTANNTMGNCPSGNGGAVFTTRNYRLVQ